MILYGILIIIIIVLFCLLLLKRQRDYYSEEQKIKDYNEIVEKLKEEVRAEQDKKDNIINQINEASNHYEQLKEIVNNYKAEQDNKISDIESEAKAAIDDINWKIKTRQNDYDSLIAPFETIEKEKLEKLFYCIYLTEEDKCDIIYLLNEVAPKIKHQDIISKLIWQEFIRSTLDTTIKRVGITDNPGIYKLTNIDNNKCYIGKAVNVKKRIQDHFKSVVGIQSISDQAVHEEIRKVGLDKWTIEQICECPKEELNEKEKFYIDFFKATEYGYNLKAGG